MKKEFYLFGLGLMAMVMVVLAGCTVIDNPQGADGGVKSVELKNFSNTGCKPTTRSVYDEDHLVTLELTATEKGGLYVTHSDVVLNCGIKDYDAKIEIDGNKITVTEFGDNSRMTFCECAIDFGYEIGPLEEGKPYKLNIICAHARIFNRTVDFVYSSKLKWSEQYRRQY